MDTLIPLLSTHTHTTSPQHTHAPFNAAPTGTQVHAGTWLGLTWLRMFSIGTYMFSLLERSNVRRQQASPPLHMHQCPAGGEDFHARFAPATAGGHATKPPSRSRARIMARHAAIEIATKQGAPPGPCDEQQVNEIVLRLVRACFTFGAMVFLFACSTCTCPAHSLTLRLRH